MTARLRPHLRLEHFRRAIFGDTPQGGSSRTVGDVASAALPCRERPTATTQVLRSSYRSATFSLSGWIPSSLFGPALGTVAKKR